MCQIYECIAYFSLVYSIDWDNIDWVLVRFINAIPNTDKTYRRLVLRAWCVIDTTFPPYMNTTLYFYCMRIYVKKKTENTTMFTICCVFNFFSFHFIAHHFVRFVFMIKKFKMHFSSVLLVDTVIWQLVLRFIHMWIIKVKISIEDSWILCVTNCSVYFVLSFELVNYSQFLISFH